MKFGYKNSKMVKVNQFFKPPYYFSGRISSKIVRKVGQENCEVMSTFHIILKQSETHLVCLSCSAESATEAIFLHSIVFHVCFTLP